MEFMNVTLLAGTLAGVLPIVVHLIHRERPRVVKFTALRFIRQSVKSTSTSMRLKHLLLLLLRILLIVLFALILARPLVKESSFAVGKTGITQAVFVLDDSFLMEIKGEDGQTHFERAKKAASELISNLPPGSALAFVAASQDALDFSIDLSSVMRALDLAKTTPGAPAIVPAVQRAFDLFKKRSGGIREIYVFSNMSSAVWKSLPLEKPEDTEDVRLVVVDAGPDRPENVILLQAKPSSFTVDQNASIRIDCDVFNDGPGRKVDLELVLNGQKRASSELEMAEKETARVSFNYEFHEAGVAQGTVRVTNEDSLLLDNLQYFSVQVLDPLRILAVTGPNGKKGAFFLIHALSPSGLRGRERVELTVIEDSELPQFNLEEADTVFLINVPRIEKEDWDRLSRRVEAGRGVAIVAGPAMESDFYGALPNLPLDIRGLIENRDSNLVLSPIVHPFLAKFQKEGLNSLRLPRFRTWLELGMPEGADAATVLATFGQEFPALLEFRAGLGRYFVFASSFGTDWNDLPKWPVFPPFVYEMVNFLAGRKEEATVFHPGDPVPIPVRSEEKDATISIFEPGSERPVLLTISPDTGRAAHTAGKAIGNAQVFIKNERGTRKLGFSLNLNTKPEHYPHVTPEQVTKVFPKAETLAIGEDLTHKVAKAKRGSELFPLFLIFLMLMFCSESFLSNRIYK